ncbi:phage head-tail adapter protein [Streptococcus sp. sy004]|uniref:phage head-tail adapter protein n=1 Tax=Streptococcus sp. sy004 TaxID=2600149 RepID=UPI0011B62497|nr:phage head-tail adapter protein [Streptococcus sp. sy004]TWT12073.1 phage head-tail adapter protein [Streptococcus sp. sy004]
MARKETTNGDLRTPVVFLGAKVATGLDGRDEVSEKLFETFAEVYNPSLKDMEVASGHGVRASLTLKIRDPLTAYQLDNRHFVQIMDRRFSNHLWEIVSIRPDFHQRDFLVLVLGGDGSG